MQFLGIEQKFQNLEQNYQDALEISYSTSNLQ